MRVALAMAAWIVALLPRDGVPARTLPGIEDEAFSQACVRAHNKFRSEVSPRASDMLYMTWDPALARIAKAWARKCRFEHNGQLHSKTLHPNFTSVGENIWTGSVSIFSVSSAITSWYDEVHDYDFQTQKCNKVCGHYTQRLSCARRHVRRPPMTGLCRPLQNRARESSLRPNIVQRLQLPSREREQESGVGQGVEDTGGAWPLGGDLFQERRVLVDVRGDMPGATWRSGQGAL
uniref:SCP domain-containing protein n=1 Tax=Canis lupus familiaris TaxID=9615 RepID=A0A8C0SHQ8_CANLF